MHTAHQATGPAAKPHDSQSGVSGLAPEVTSLADVVERLFAEFDCRLGLVDIVVTVRRCRRELDIVHGPALPEPVERLARHRLESITTVRRERSHR